MNETIDIGEALSRILENTEKNSPIDFQYYKCLENRKIILNGDISFDTLEEVIIPLMEMDNDGTGKPIELIINTIGGDAFTGFSLVDVIEHMKTDLTIRIFGLVASMGIYVAMAHANNPKVKTICSKFSVGLIHAGSLNFGDTVSANCAKDVFKFNEKYDEIIREYVMSHTKIGEEMYQKIERYEYWMTANEMLELGVVSEIV